MICEVVSGTIICPLLNPGRALSDIDSILPKAGNCGRETEGRLRLSGISNTSDPIAVSGKTPSNINCIPKESGVENICLLSTIPSREYFC